MGALIVIWAIAEYFQRKKPQPERMRSAAMWAFGLSTLASFGDEHIAPRDFISGGYNWKVFFLAMGINIFYVAVLYGLRVLSVKIGKKFRKAPPEASQDN